MDYCAALESLDTVRGLQRMAHRDFHMTNFPYGRGGSPLQNLMKRGHHTTTITALRGRAR